MSNGTSSLSELVIFTNSQTPLAVRYPHPSKPSLIVPPLLHRTLHNALDNEPPSLLFDNAGSRLVIPHPDSLGKHDVPYSTAETDHELTVKFHFIEEASPETKAKWAEDAMRLLCRTKGLGGVDSLLVGWKGVDYKGKKTATDPWADCDEDEPVKAKAAPLEDALVDDIQKTWDLLGRLRADGEGQGKVKKLGTLYMPLEILETLSRSVVRPSVNSMDTPDCHHLPKQYADFARTQGIELWAGGGGEGSNPCPSADLHITLQEFADRLPSPLSELLREPVTSDSSSQSAAVEVSWVLGYTLLSKARNVVKDKGYIISARVRA